MINITIEEIFDRLFNELKTEYKNIEPRNVISNDYAIVVIQEVIKKNGLKFTKYSNDDTIEYTITANEEVVFSGVYSSTVKEEYNLEEAKLLKNLWDRLEKSFELRKKESISNKYEKLCKALKGE